MTTETTTAPALTTCGCTLDASVCECAECRCGGCGCKAE
jgi:hypothetical protein